MAFQITQVLADADARAALQQLHYHDDTHAEVLLTNLDTFLTEYVTTNEVNGIEPCSKNDDDEALADITTAWLDDKGQGRNYWPCLDSSEHPGHLRYDDQDHWFIANQVEILVCALNRARRSDGDELARCIWNSANFRPKYAQKNYTAIAQAMLIKARKSEDLRVRPCLSNENLCRALSPLLNNTGWTIDDSIDTLSDKFQAQLWEDKVVGLPDCFFPLQCHYSHAKQAEAATPSLVYLKKFGFVSAIGDSDEQRLHSAARTCGRLCFRNYFELPAGLNDTMLPDLLAKFAVMELGRQTPAAEI